MKVSLLMQAGIQDSTGNILPPRTYTVPTLKLFDAMILEQSSESQKDDRMTACDAKGNDISGRKVSEQAKSF